MIPPSGAAPSPKGQASDHDPTAGTRARGEASAPCPRHFTGFSPFCGVLCLRAWGTRFLRFAF